ncbi:MAG: phospholipase D-like domain-containing protein [Acidobacteriota bacterium]|nr:phospholipase D-like domain-containing protein [Acidobacteriota bacterium]
MRPALARLGRWALVGAFGLAALIGVQHVSRGTSVRHVHGVGADSTPVSPAEPQFPLSVAMLTGAALLPASQVAIALNGNGTFSRLWGDLRSARQSITLQLYVGQDGRVADTLCQILAERAAAGVQVFLLYDAFGFQGMPSEHQSALRAAGAVVVPFRPLRLSTLHMAQNRSHVRGIVVDGHIGWTGGFSIDDRWLGDGRTSDSWRDTNVRFEGPAVRQLQAAFAAAWAEATGTLFSGRATVGDGDGDRALAGLLYATPTLGSTSAERFFAMTIAGARKTLYITNSYFAPDDNFVGLLADAARRAVDVRVLTGGPRTDVRTVRLAGRAQYAPLLEAGVRIYEWQPTTLHAKTFVADGVWATIGSINFDNRSLTLNDESTLMILDENIGQQMDTIFLDDLRHAEEITLLGFRQRSWLPRILERAASVIQRLL